MVVWIRSILFWLMVNCVMSRGASGSSVDVIVEEVVWVKVVMSSA